MVASLVIFVLALYAGLCAVLFVNQRSQMYFPTIGRADVPSIVLQRDEVKLLVSVREGSGAPAVVYFGGNAEDVSLSVGELAMVFPDAAVYAPHYRGYGGSEGAPSEPALIADGLALFDKVRAIHSDVVVVGRSLGSGIAIQVAAARAVKRLVLVTPFDSMVAVASGHFPLFPVSMLLLDRYESVRFAPRIRAPVTLILAGRDRVIPAANSERLAEALVAVEPRVVVVEQADHNDLGAFPAYHAALRGED